MAGLSAGFSRLAGSGMGRSGGRVFLHPFPPMAGQMLPQNGAPVFFLNFPPIGGQMSQRTKRTAGPIRAVRVGGPRCLLSDMLWVTRHGTGDPQVVGDPTCYFLRVTRRLSVARSTYRLWRPREAGAETGEDLFLPPLAGSPRLSMCIPCECPFRKGQSVATAS